MFFTGDPSSRRKVDLGGRSNKERDRQNFLEEARLEREQRRRVLLQNLSAGRIQDSGDCLRLVQTCRLLQQALRETGSIEVLFAENGQSGLPLIEFRVKQLARLCMNTPYFYQATLKEDLLKPTQPLCSMSNSATILLDTVLILAGNEVRWSGSVVNYLVQNKLFHLLRGIFLTVGLEEGTKKASCIENDVFILASRNAQRADNGNSKLTKWSFATDILSIPLLWQRFPTFKQDEAMLSEWKRELEKDIIWRVKKKFRTV